MNEFIGDINHYMYLYKIKLVDIKYIEKEEYSYFFYTFIDTHGNTIIAKEKNELYYSFIKYTCSITGRVINGIHNKEWDELVRVEIQNGIIYSIAQQYKMTNDELLQLKKTKFGGNQRVNFYNPKTLEIFCFTGVNDKRKIQIGDVITGTSILKKHAEFKGIKQNIINVTKINEAEWIE